MKEITDLEIIQLNTERGNLVALLSYKDQSTMKYDTVRVPVNLRELQFSVRGNPLCDQSIKNEVDVVMEKPND